MTDRVSLNGDLLDAAYSDGSIERLELEAALHNLAGVVMRHEAAS